VGLAHQARSHNSSSSFVLEAGHCCTCSTLYVVSVLFLNQYTEQLITGVTTKTNPVTRHPFPNRTENVTEASPALIVTFGFIADVVCVVKLFISCQSEGRLNLGSLSLKRIELSAVGKWGAQTPTPHCLSGSVVLEFHKCRNVMIIRA
jgi:hypothetical protein